MEITKKFLEDKIASLSGQRDKLLAEAQRLQNDAIATGGAVQMCEMLMEELRLKGESRVPDAAKLAKVE